MGTKNRKSVLVVDDAPENIDALREILGGQYAVMAATGGRQALKACRSARPPDIVLLDVVMPEMDGHEVCRLLKADERTRGIPVIFVTARSEADEEAYGFALGAADYLVKPVSAPVVLARIRTHLTLLERSRHLEKLLRERTASLESKSQEAEVALDRANAAERRIISVSEETLQRVGRELHDDLGQVLTGIAFMSEVLCQRLKSRGAAEAEDMAKVTALVNETISRTRTLAQGLYPVELGEAGLPAMLERLAGRTEEMYGVECAFLCDGACEMADELAAINLYRIAQEAVNNAVKHGAATKITVTLSTAPGRMVLEIADNGRGMPVSGAGAGGGLGMHSMQYRASLLGAAFLADSTPGAGVRIVVSLPVR